VIKGVKEEAAVLALRLSPKVTENLAKLSPCGGLKSSSWRNLGWLVSERTWELCDANVGL